ncbi:hypothetical protein JW921_10590, partial [Candidatus Fermentibacterales bacterium]|nr:hypothetical protein [Candidatus Fermentibacterales bacterium]
MVLLLCSALDLVPVSSLAASIWEVQAQGSPRGAPLLSSNGMGTMDVFVPLGESGLGGWDSSGDPLPGFPLASAPGVVQRPASVYLPYCGMHAVVFADNGGSVHAVDRYGGEAPGWPVSAGAGIITGVTSADLDSDGEPEICFGTNDGRLHVYSMEGCPEEGWPVDAGSQLLFQPAL